MDRLKPSNGNYDAVIRGCFKTNKSSCISWFLVASYAYYIKYESLMSDTAFDKMCKWMLENYDSLDHIHKHLVTKGMLIAGSGFNLKEEDYPSRIIHTAPTLIKQLYEGTGVAS